jgi:hypothetical protein
MDQRSFRRAGQSVLSTALSIMLFTAALSFGAPVRAEVGAADAKAGIVECSETVLKDHNPGLADNPDRLVCFAGYVSNVNTKPRSGKPKYLGVPHWVAHHVKRAPNSPESGARPNVWFNVPELAQQGIVPIDGSYVFSAGFRTRIGTTAGTRRRNIWSNGSATRRRCIRTTSSMHCRNCTTSTPAPG